MSLSRQRKQKQLTPTEAYELAEEAAYEQELAMGLPSDGDSFVDDIGDWEHQNIAANIVVVAE